MDARVDTAHPWPLHVLPVVEVMNALDRIIHDPAVMGGRPCIRGLRMTVGTIVGLLAAGRTEAENPAGVSIFDRAMFRRLSLTSRGELRKPSSQSVKILIEMNWRRRACPRRMP
jgi:hypothetical protein